MKSPPGKELDRLLVDIACLDYKQLRASLISTTGSHCEVWRSSKRHEPLDGDDQGASYTEFVIKWPLAHYSESESRLLARHYRLLKETLDEVIPDALFVITKINGTKSVFVLAKAVNIWFNIANQQNEEEAVRLLCTNPKSRIQLARFVRAANTWRTSDNPRMIDLFGLDNLVMDTNREIHFLDSFFVFFFEDMFHLIDNSENDKELKDKLEVSVKRLTYLEHLLERVKQHCEERKEKEAEVTP
ncbi:MAG: hypothetical protein KZQ73_01650 [Candidatus Thiodiazotropha sp. (ex Semelilucina semeliformis)]|nr:hypothetical protein [Candidatus Thiodiazotropha sp. (ex Semelilucina semeliformis)]